MSKARVYGYVRKPITRPDKGKARCKAVHHISKILETKLPSTPEGGDARKLRPSWMQQVDQNFNKGK